MRTLLGVCLGGAILATVGCSSEAPIYPGGPAGPAAALHVSSSLFVVQVGGTPATVGGRVEDAAGNPTADVVSFASCDAAKVGVTAGAALDQWSSSATISAVALGASCVTASGAGMTDTIRVRMAPGTIVLTGPDSVISGTTGTFSMAFYAVDGSPLTAGAEFPIPTLTSSNTALLALEATDPQTYDGRGRTPGNAVLQVTSGVDFASVTALKVVKVVPEVFQGTLSASSAAPGTLITATRAAGGTAWDSDVGVKLASTTAYVDAITADVLTFAVPATGSAAASTLLFSNIGPDQLAKSAPFTATKATADVYAPGNLDATCSGAGVAGAPEFSSIASAGNNVYFVHGGYGTGSASRGACNGGTKPDHYFAYTTGANAVTIDVALSWADASDVDMFVCTTDLVDCPGSGGGSGSTTGESVTGAALAANTTYYIVASMYSAGTSVTNIKMHLTVH